VASFAPLDPQGFKEYYRQRNLLKVSVTAEHVANAVVFFATEASAATTGVNLAGGRRNSRRVSPIINLFSYSANLKNSAAVVRMPPLKQSMARFSLGA